MNNLKRHKFSIIYLTIAYLIPFIIQAGLFGYQVSKGIMSIWNIITIVMMIFLYGFAFKRVSQANINAEERIAKKQEDFEKVKQELKKKVSKKTRFIVVFVAIAAAALSVLFHHLYTTKTEGLELVNSKVVDQWGERNHMWGKVAPNAKRVKATHKDGTVVVSDSIDKLSEHIQIARGNIRNLLKKGIVGKRGWKVEYY